MKNKILVIEDDRAISELLCMNLEAAGYETVAAYDGEEAQRLLLWQEDADLAVVDIMLPGKDGFELMENFKKKELPVLYLTAKDDVASKVKGLKLGAEDYMVKPFEMLELLVRIEKVLERTGRARKVLTIRNIMVDMQSHQVYKDGLPVRGIWNDSAESWKIQCSPCVDFHSKYSDIYLCTEIYCKWNYFRCGKRINTKGLIL